MEAEMNYSKVLDAGTLGQVILRSPAVAVDTQLVVGYVLRVLLEENERPALAQKLKGLDGRDYWQMRVMSVAERLPVAVTPHRVGKALSELGLRTLRTRVGYMVFWTEEQAKLLKEALA
jgi:hypothetical protein